MYKILKAETLAAKIHLMVVHAPRVASHCQPGQFIIVKMDEKGERIPLTICDYDREEGTITIVFQEVGASTIKLSLIHIYKLQYHACIHRRKMEILIPEKKESECDCVVIKRGDIFYADLRPVVGSEQGGVRPVLIIQNDVGNRHSPTVICAAITSKMNKAKLPTHIEIDASCLLYTSRCV